MERTDIIIIGIMLSVSIFAGFYYMDRTYQECTSNPLIFAGKLYEETYPDMEVFGTLTLLPINSQIDELHPANDERANAKMIHFNSKEFFVE